VKINSLNEVSRGMPLEVSNICRFNPKAACDEIIWFAGGPEYARQMPKHQDRRFVAGLLGDEWSSLPMRATDSEFWGGRHDVGPL
jgi:hypothetical protein